MKTLNLFCNRSLLTGKMGYIKNIISAAVVTFVIIYATRDGAYETYEQTRSVLFSVMIGSLMLGFFNSITLFHSKKHFIMDDLKKDLPVGTYVLDTMLNEAFLCIAQAVAVTVVFFAFLEYPSKGIVFNANLDYLVTFFLTAYSADCLGMFLGLNNSSIGSCMVIVPVTVIIQMLLSGCLFDLNADILEKVSRFTTAFYSFSCLGSIADLNSEKLPYALQLAYTEIQKTPNNLFDPSATYVTWCWFRLGILSVVLILMTYLLLTLKLYRKY